MKKDTTPTQLGARGDFLPRVTGVRRVPAMFCWAGDRITSSTHYYEQGMHALAVGPCTGLLGIYSAGVPIWQTTIQPSGTPSGSYLESLGGNGHFYIYWGEPDQPVNSVLGDIMGTYSRWPHICYVHWKYKSLVRGSALWPELMYDVRSEFCASTAYSTGSGLSSSSCYLEEEVLDRGNFGMNPAHAIWDLLTNTYPHGLGIPASYLDKNSFEEMGVTCESEHIPLNFAIHEGRDGIDILALILDHVGYVCPQLGQALLAIKVRPGDTSTYPIMVDDSLMPPKVEVVRIRGRTRATRALFIYPARKNGYSDTDVGIVDDGAEIQFARPQPKTVTLDGVTDHRTALRVSTRRKAEVIDDIQKISFSASRGARNLQPGNAIIIDGTIARVANVELSMTSPETKVEALVDNYSEEATAFSTTEPPVNTGNRATPDPDLWYTVIQLPASTELAVLRVRANSQITGAYIYASADGGTTYRRIGHQVAHFFGGTLNSNLSASGASPQAVGPSITPFREIDTADADDNTLLDLSTDSNAWNNGQQIMTVGGVSPVEVCFVESVTPVSGGYRLNNILRAEYGTSEQAWSYGAKVVIANGDLVSRISDATFQVGATIFIKCVPHTDFDIADISSVTAVSITIA